MKLAVIVPTRLQRDVRDGELLLERALRSVARQSLPQRIALSVVVGLDPATPLPKLEVPLPIAFVHGSRARQSSALNAALDAALKLDADALALLEDDDWWEPEKLQLQLPLLDEYDLVTSNQRVVDAAGGELEQFDFPTPSGWLMRVPVLLRVGNFDETIVCHPDTEWLGRANALGIRRVHLVSSDSVSRTLDQVAQRSTILRVAARPLVTRTFNGDGTMGQIRSGSLEPQSRLEYEHFLHRFGEAPF